MSEQDVWLSAGLGDPPPHGPQCQEHDWLGVRGGGMGGEYNALANIC